jgi:acetyl esterase/lipase
MMGLMAHYYSPDEKDKTNPLAWPYFATEEDLKGLPPHYIDVDELDPLRDEGLAYYRKLSHAGVAVHGNIKLGVAHGSWGIWGAAFPEVYQGAIDSIAAFAKRVQKIR